MVQIKAIRQHYNGKEDVYFNDIPSYLPFVKLYELSDDQQYWMTMFLQDDELGDKLESLSSRSHTLGKLTVVYFKDIKFITEIPVYTLDQFKQTFANELSGLYVKHISRELDLLRIYKVIDILGEKAKTSTAYFMSVIGKRKVECLEIDDVKICDLLQSPLNTTIPSSGHWSVCSYDDEIKTLYDDRIKYLSGY